MHTTIFIVDAYFDGERHHSDGPYTIIVKDGIISQIIIGVTADLPSGDQVQRAVFAMPGLVEGHCHIFLDGSELNLAARKQYLSAPFEVMVATARSNVARSRAAGVTLLRDAGDCYGINKHIRQELQNNVNGGTQLRCPLTAIRKKGRYGGFMAVEVSSKDEIIATVSRIAASADDIKVLLTGIIDFEKGEVKGEPQFDLEECRLIVETARSFGCPTFVHCSGVEGLRIAIEAGVDSIEHGFFMNYDLLAAMADKEIAWVPTLSPVYFQFTRPELAGWNSTVVAGLKNILDNHLELIARATDLGVPIVAGSDAGSFGVPHGTGLVNELLLFGHAGMPLDNILASATSVPRSLWKHASGNITAGNRTTILLMDDSPYRRLDAIRNARIPGQTTSELTFSATSCTTF